MRKLILQTGCYDNFFFFYYYTKISVKPLRFYNMCVVNSEV